jgi:hypothetical protein
MVLQVLTSGVCKFENHFSTPNVQCWGTWSLYVACLRYLSLLNTKCDVLVYWRHRSVCYTSLFTTSLVTTISFYNVLGPSDVVSRSGPGSSLGLLFGSSLICVSGRSFVSLFCVSLLCVCLLSSVSPLCLFSICVCPFICCPSIRVFAPRIEDTFPYGFISRCCGFQQFGCFGILSRWVATLRSDVPCILEVVA